LCKVMSALTLGHVNLLGGSRSCLSFWYLISQITQFNRWWWWWWWWWQL